MGYAIYFGVVLVATPGLVIVHSIWLVVGANLCMVLLAAINHDGDILAAIETHNGIILYHNDGKSLISDKVEVSIHHYK